MRTIVVSGGVLVIATAFGLGVVFGRFVLTRDLPNPPTAINEVVTVPGVGDYVTVPSPAFEAAPSLSVTLPAAPPPLPASAPPEPPLATAPRLQDGRAQAAAAIAPSPIEPGCAIQVSQDASVRSWDMTDKVIATAIGQTCATATINLSLEPPDGAALYTLQAPARDFGITEATSEEEVRNRLSQLLPREAVRAGSYPEWHAKSPAPTRTEFSRDAYETVRAADAPVICLKLPTGSARCIAADPVSNRLKVFSRG
jgi:hypothetical protein